MKEPTPLHEQKNFALTTRLGYAYAGIVNAWKREASFRFQILAATGLSIFCLIAKPQAYWCALFATNVAVVLTLELVNSSVEALLDRLHPERHPEIGFIKNCLAGAVYAEDFRVPDRWTSFLDEDMYD